MTGSPRSDADREVWKRLYEKSVSDRAELHRVLRDIAGACGHPDAAQACRNVLSLVREATK